MRKSSKRWIIIMLFAVMVMAGCARKDEKEDKRHQQIRELAAKICSAEVADLALAEDAIQIQCSQNDRTYAMSFNNGTFDLLYHTQIPSVTLTYRKNGEPVPAVVQGRWMIDSASANEPEIYLNVVAGVNQDQEFDMVVDLREKKMYRTDPKTLLRGNELEFLPTLHEALLTYASEALIASSAPLLDHYGELYQIQNLMLKKDVMALREDAYDLPFDLIPVLYMQYPIREEQGVLIDGKSGMYRFDLKRKLVIIDTCKTECDYKSTRYDIANDVLVYYPETSREIIVDPNTCTTEKFCEVSKNWKTSVIAAIAFHSKQAPFKQAAEYNAQFNRANMAELNKYLAKIKENYQE